jgi:hypothetical protein
MTLREIDMNPRLIASTCFIAVLLCVASPFVAAQTQLNITLEGPWILYTDTTLAKKPVLVVISAAGDVTKNKDDPKYFHTIQVTAGDGYPVESPAVYCLTFDDVCGRAGADKLTTDGYPNKVQPLPVNAPGSWNWQSLSNSQNAIAFILPMPDFYNTDGTWYMRFGKVFDHTGKQYKPYNGMERYSVGVQLHYDNGPGGFILQECNLPVNLGACKNILGTDMDNTGTLSITMKSPHNNNACDPHVRHTYPKTLALLGAQTNPEIAVIDPAKGYANGKGMYDQDKDKYRCLDKDDDQGGTTTGSLMSDNMSSWRSQLRSIQQFIAKFEAKPESYDPRLGDEDLYLNQIKAAIDQLKLDEGYYPRFSQLTLIETLVNLSEARAEVLLRRKESDSRGTKAAPAARTADASITLQQLDDFEKAFLNSDPPTKNGNDCKAAIMVVQ